MTEQTRRKELVAQFKEARPEAGVYRIVNTRTGRCLLGCSPNLASVRGKLDFARSTNSAGVLDLRLRSESRQFGIDAFELEVLEVLPTTPEMTPEQIRTDLTLLTALWRERLDAKQLY